MWFSFERETLETVYVLNVSEQQDVTEDLSEKNVLGGFRWAFDSAVAKTLEDYSEEDGHDAAFCGVLRYTLLRDRIDRVFHCGRYEVDTGTAEEGIDELLAGLSDADRKSIPRIPAGMVVRSDLEGSPGWVIGPYRLLLASAPYGKIQKIRWSGKSKIKRRVARQRNPQTPAPTLFDGTGIDITSMEVGVTQLDLITFVVAHTLDLFTGRTELGFGRTRLNPGGGSPWHWFQDIGSLPPGGGGNWTIDTPMPTGPNGVPDAPVRMRRRAGEAGNRAS